MFGASNPYLLVDTKFQLQTLNFHLITVDHSTILLCIFYLVTLLFLHREDWNWQAFLLRQHWPHFRPCPEYSRLPKVAYILDPTNLFKYVCVYLWECRRALKSKRYALCPCALFCSMPVPLNRSPTCAIRSSLLFRFQHFSNLTYGCKAIAD